MDVSLSRARGGRTVALGASLLLNVILLAVVAWPDSEPAEPVEPAAVVAEAPVDPAPAPAPEEAVEAPAAEAAVAAKGDEPPSGAQVTVASLQGSIPQTMAAAADPYGDFVSATLSRVLVWDLDLRKDLRPNDEIEAMWSLGSTDTVIIEAARYHSQKLGKTIQAYRFQATGDKYPSYWSADGVEVPHQLRHSPLAEYEQVTSLLKDRPTHHGMDFKVDVGTPALATYDGVVTRVNWNWGPNGNCVEIRFADGVVAKYLHLSENRVKAGDHVHAGDVIALTGNTGHSTGPHLHYQLNRGTKVLDPIKYQGTDRRTLPAGDRAAFGEVVKAANVRLDSGRALAAK